MKRSAAEALGHGGSGAVSWESQTQQQPDTPVERLNPAIQAQLNLRNVKERAISLHKTISRLLEHFNSLAGANAVPIWNDLMGQVAMVNLELFRIIDDVKKVPKAFVVYPRNVTSETAARTPVVLSSKVLPEMEKEENSLRRQIFQGIEHLPVSAQIEALRTRIHMIGEACESAEQVIAEARKAHFSTRGHSTNVPTTDLVKAALIREEEEKLRNAVNHGEGLRLPKGGPLGNKSLPAHMQDALNVNEGQSEAIFESNGGRTEAYLRSSPNNDSPGTSVLTQLNDQRGPAQDSASKFMK